MSDVMAREPIDDVAARAVAALRAEVSTRSLSELSLRTPRRWVARVVVLAVVAAVVVGLVAIGTDHNQSIGNNDPTRLHWLLRDLPSGWKPTDVFDSATGPTRPVPDVFATNLYATDAAPLGPMLSVQGTTDTNNGVEIGSYSSDVVSYEEFQLDGKRAAFATLQNGGRGLYVEINSAWVYLSSRGISDDELRQLAATLAPDITGHYDVGESAVPDGLHKVVSSSDPPRGLVSVDYSSPASPNGVLIFAVSPAAPALVGFSPPSYNFERATVGDFSGFIGSLTSDITAPPITNWFALWRRDGLDFELTGQGVSKDQILAAAASASHASPDEWEHLLGSKIFGPGDTAPAGTSPAEVPIETTPTIAGGPRDVAITVKVDDVTTNEEQWSGALPTGESWSVKISRVYDRMDVRYDFDGNVASVFGVSTNGSSVVCCNPMAITNNPNATALRVLRSNGDRYTIPLHEMPGTGGVRVAVIALPDNVLAELIDANGNVLESYAPH